MTMTNIISITSSLDDAARANWNRYQYGKDRGHNDEYLPQAQRCEDMYMGQGKQWTLAARAQLEEERRPCYELNEIKPSINAALGYQIQNRADIAFKPRGGDADLNRATILSKVAMQVADMAGLHWHETQVFSDGVIQQRGYFDLRMNFDDNIKGEIAIGTLDPMDVIPDPDAKSYDPDDWSDVLVTRWLTLDEIEQLYGKEARQKAEQSHDAGVDFGELDDETERNKFASRNRLGAYDAGSIAEDGLLRYRIIDRQRFVYEPTACLVFPRSGDVQTEAHMAPDSIADALAQGAVRAKRMRRRVKWTVTTLTATLHDTLSPYEHYTVVPYFAYFRRGRTGGMVDDAIGPQEIVNKAMSQFVHILSSSANSGWITEQGSITNMTSEELEKRGAATGLHIEVAKGTKNRPQKIQPNQVPTGVDRLIDRADRALKDVTVPEAMRGIGGANEPGIAIQSKQFAAQQQLAVPLDNLAYTRRLLARRILKLIQRYYDSYRVFRITETDPETGKPIDRQLEINRFDPLTGNYINDVTIGTYDVVVTEQPAQVTFENSQFKQALEMRQAGVAIPDPTLIKHSNLADKQDILASMQQRQRAAADPMAEARARLIDAQARKTDAQAVDVAIKSQYSGTQAALEIARNPGAAPIADSMLRSAGYVDRDAGPIVPQPGQALPGLDEPQRNTDPLTPAGPASPAAGQEGGIERPGPDLGYDTPTN